MNKKLRIIPVVIVVLLGLFIGGYYLLRPDAAESRIVSGTMEALEVRIMPELGGRVVEVLVEEGDAVQAGDGLIRLDSSLYLAQRSQAEDAWQAAEANARAVRANASLLEVGPSKEQLDLAQAVVDQAQTAVNAAREAWEDLPEDRQDTSGGKTLKQQLDAAEAGLNTAQAQYDLTAAGARPEQISAALAGAEAAESQAAAAKAALDVLDVQINKLTLTAPVSGVVLTRAVEPGELAAPGSTLLIVAQLDHLTLTVYIPEDEYGKVHLGQKLDVTVDSFPGEVFPGTVSYIAGQAEFTPRNIQTVKSRKITVFAVRLELDNMDGKLKPGMPASVTLPLVEK